MGDSLNYKDLLNQLTAKGQRQPDYTKALIKEKLADQDQEIATTSCKVSLACPLGKMRMSFPCRASTCDHLQCFDAQLYLMMNEKKPKWVCPVCNKAAYYENLLIGKDHRLNLDAKHFTFLIHKSHYDGKSTKIRIAKFDCVAII